MDCEASRPFFFNDGSVNNRNFLKVTIYLALSRQALSRLARLIAVPAANNSIAL